MSLGTFFTKSERIYEGDSYYDYPSTITGPTDYIKSVHTRPPSYSNPEKNYDTHALERLESKRKTCSLSKREKTVYRKLVEAKLKHDMMNDRRVDPATVSDFDTAARMIKDGIAYALGIKVSVNITPDEDDPFIFGWKSPLEEESEHSSKRTKLE